MFSAYTLLYSQKQTQQCLSDIKCRLLYIALYLKFVQNICIDNADCALISLKMAEVFGMGILLVENYFQRL